jgi:dihydroflavonol-4-reductase
VSRRVAVTGARGFIGQHVIAALAARGDTPQPVARPFERSALAASFHDVDAVIHLAGVVSAVREEDFHTANVESTRIVAEAARDAGKPLIHISSLAAAGPAPPSAPRSEDDPPRPITTYGRTKLEGERAIENVNGLRWTILRPGVVYGPGDRAMRPLFNYARRGLLPLVGDRSAAYTFIYIDDAVRAILAAADRDALGKPVFLGYATPVTSRELMESIQAALGTSAWLVPVPRLLTRLVASIGDLAGSVTGKPATINSRRFAELYSPGFVCRVDRMRELLGVVADVDLHEGLARSCRWYESTIQA